MHIGDGLIPLWQCAIYWLIAIIFISASLRWARNDLDEMKIPLLAALAAGIFAIQLMNVPVAVGASGHVVGAVMAAIILGSVWASVLLLTLVLVVQGFLQGDGGITAMGANILSMGIISGFVGFYIYKALKDTIGQFKASFIGGWAGLFISSLVVAVQLFIAGTIPLKEGLMAMGGFHAIIGVGEGLVTAYVVTAIASARPDIMNIQEETDAMKGNIGNNLGKNKNKQLFLAGITIVIVLAVLAPFIASTNPDGLDSTLIKLVGDGDKEVLDEKIAENDPLNYNAPMSGYSIDGMGKAGEVGAILGGIILILGISFGLSRIMKKKCDCKK